MKYKVSGLQKVELLKALSVLHFKNKEHDKSTLCLKEAIDTLSEFPHMIEE